MCNKWLEIFSSIYSRQILSEIMQKLNINIGKSSEISQILEIIYQDQQNSMITNHIMNIAFTTMIWHIWCERNSRIFKGIKMPFQLRNMLILQDCNYLIKFRLDYKKISKDIELVLLNLGIVSASQMELHPP